MHISSLCNHDDETVVDIVQMNSNMFQHPVWPFTLSPGMCLCMCSCLRRTHSIPMTTNHNTRVMSFTFEFHVRVSLFQRWANVAAPHDPLAVQCNQYWVEFHSVTTWCSISVQFDKYCVRFHLYCVNTIFVGLLITWSYVFFSSYQVSHVNSEKKIISINENGIRAKLMELTVIDNY